MIIYRAFLGRIGLATLAWCVSPSLAAIAQTKEDNVVNTCAVVLDEVMAIPAKQIPQALLGQARGVAIVPNVMKGGFVVGIRHGRGVMLVKDDSGRWLPPTFITLSGGSIGWQAGIQSTDVVLVFKTRQSVNSLMDGSLTIGVDAAAAAGPVGRTASAGTDSSLQAEVYSYSRSRGLFAGVAIDGSVLQVDHLAGMSYYRGGNNPHYAPALPDSAVRLMNQLAVYATTPQDAVNQPRNQPREQPRNLPSLSRSAELVRVQLVASWQKLSQLLDQQWTAYLALPADVLRGGQEIQLDALNQTLQKYVTVATLPQYASLTGRHEFSTTYQLLREYATLLVRSEQKLALPAPPEEAKTQNRGRY